MKPAFARQGKPQKTLSQLQQKSARTIWPAL